MRFRIHYTITGNNGVDYEDSIIVNGDTVEEIREKADQELVRRGGFDPWSEELT